MWYSMLSHLASSSSLSSHLLTQVYICVTIALDQRLSIRHPLSASFCRSLFLKPLAVCHRSNSCVTSDQHSLIYLPMERCLSVISVSICQKRNAIILFASMYSPVKVPHAHFRDKCIIISILQRR